MLLPQDVRLCSTALSMKTFGHTPLTHIASIVPHISAAQQAPNNNQCTRKFLRRHSCNSLRLHHCLHFCLPCSNFTRRLSQADGRGSGRRRRRARQRQRQRCAGIPRTRCRHGRRASWSPKLPSDQNSEQDNILKQRLQNQHQQQNACISGRVGAARSLGHGASALLLLKPSAASSFAAAKATLHFGICLGIPRDLGLRHRLGRGLRLLCALGTHLGLPHPALSHQAVPQGQADVLA